MSKQLGFGDSTVKRYRGDMSINSPYDRSFLEKMAPKDSVWTYIV